jgi:hypothetical protein
MPRFLVSWNASIEAENEDEAKIIVMNLLNDPNPFEFHHEFGCVIERDFND